MKGTHCLIFTITVIVLLTSCRIELYSALPEEEANQMLSILMQQNINADKQKSEKGVTLRVEKTQFINAVELLRLNGFPHRKYTTADIMFPPNQLVVSPSEEQQKIIYLKEQRIEDMLSKIEGVIQVNVSIASRLINYEKNEVPISVAVFIKYSPQVNMEIFRMQIRNLVEKAVPGLQYDHISMLMQPTSYRISLLERKHENLQKKTIDWFIQHRNLISISLILTLIIIIYLFLIGKWKIRQH